MATNKCFTGAWLWTLSSLCYTFPHFYSTINRLKSVVCLCRECLKCRQVDSPQLNKKSIVFKNFVNKVVGECWHRLISHTDMSRVELRQRADVNIDTCSILCALHSTYLKRMYYSIVVIERLKLYFGHNHSKKAPCDLYVFLILYSIKSKMWICES